MDHPHANLAIRGQFRIYAKQLFVTWPRTDVHLEDLHEWLVLKLNPGHLITSRELHQDGQSHFHAYVEFRSRKDIRDPRLLDYEGRHSNMGPVRNKQAAIANRIYANRMGNGDESSGDGYRFSGRGLIQLTGRATWQEFADSIETSLTDLDEYMQTFEGACQSACFFWESRKLNQWADAGDIVTLTKKINGGTIGLDDRKKHYEHALHILT